MRHLPALLIGCAIVGYLLVRIGCELKSGRLLARGWKPYASREDNSMLYWSSIGIEAFVVLLVACIVVLFIMGTWT
jgi:hypothetical protein